MSICQRYLYIYASIALVKDPRIEPRLQAADCEGLGPAGQDDPLGDLAKRPGLNTEGQVLARPLDIHIRIHIYIYSIYVYSYIYI